MHTVTCLLVHLFAGEFFLSLIFADFLCNDLAVFSTGLSQPPSHAISECKILLFNIWPWFVLLSSTNKFIQAKFTAMWSLHEVMSLWWPMGRPAMFTGENEDYLTKC